MSGSGRSRQRPGRATTGRCTPSRRRRARDANVNPATLLNRSFRPKAESERWDYFTDDELARLWRSFEARKDTLGLYLSKAAVTTGLRIGEIAALTRKDLDLKARTLTVRQAYRPRLACPRRSQGRAAQFT